tara:strand:+ start:15942 stop:17918 length:1977 start_codon:yes stop_codon:yes gene_type:complete
MSFYNSYIFFVLLFLVVNIDAQEYSIENVTTKNGLPSNIVYDIQQDEIGYLWIATEKGLVKFDGVDFTLIHKQKTTTIFIDRRTIYTGLENGLFIKNKSKEQFLKSKKVQVIFKHKKDIFAGTIEGIYRLEGNKLQSLKINATIDSSSINDVLKIENKILITSSNGLYRFIKNLTNSNLIKLKKDNFTSIDKLYDGLIAANSNAEIIVFNNDSIIKTIKTISNISSLKKLKNEVWITSKTEGIEIYALPSFSFKQKINKYNTLQTNVIYNVFRDNQNTTFIASKKGIYILKNNNSQSSSKPNPKVYFENLQINHQNVDTLLATKNLKLAPSNNNIAFSFKTVHLQNPKKVKYRYKLNGDFSPWSFNNRVQFANLNPGKYEFTVQSKVDEKESILKSFSFSIDAPFYQKAWFIFSISIVFLVISYLALDYYIKRINKINKHNIDRLKLQNRLLSLEQKALQLQMNPHFIFNVLNGIKALGNNGKAQELNSTISKFSVLLRGMLNNARKEEITLEEEITLLKSYIDLEQRMSSKLFTYSIHTNLNNIDTEEILIPTMLIQPFIENCIQHAFEKNATGSITLNFEVLYRFLHITVLDNGIGIHQSKKRKGNTMHTSVALNVSKERLNIINTNNSFTIEEIINNNEVKGTKVSFKIPLKTDY